MPSADDDDVCTVSLRKMSSLSLSEIEFLLRITVAIPLTAATLPIGSSEAAGAGVGSGVADGSGVGAAGACAGSAWASRNGVDIAAPTVKGAPPTAAGEGAADAAFSRSVQPTRPTTKQSHLEATKSAPTTRLTDWGSKEPCR